MNLNIRIIAGITFFLLIAGLLAGAYFKGVTDTTTNRDNKDNKATINNIREHDATEKAVKSMDTPTLDNILGNWVQDDSK